MFLKYCMVTVVHRTKAHFRIQIYDLVEKKTKTISLTNHSELTLEKLKEKIIRCLEKE